MTKVMRGNKHVGGFFPSLFTIEDIRADILLMIIARIDVVDEKFVGVDAGWRNSILIR